MKFQVTSLVILGVLVCLSSCEPPQLGPYSYEYRDYPVDSLQAPFAEVVVAYPTNAPANTTFPFISFAHGAFGGGFKTRLGHLGILKSLASHGFIVAALKNCQVGCRDGGWDTYYEEQLKVIVWAQSPEMRNDDVIGKVSHALGYGIAGHSMGGQATGRSAVRAATYNIKAAIVLHPFAAIMENLGRDIHIPIAGFTGTEDGCCGEDATRKYYDDSPAPKTLANMVGARHTEPNLPNSEWGVYMAAFFKVWMQGDQGQYYDLMSNAANPDSLCSYHDMATCEHQNLKALSSN